MPRRRPVTTVDSSKVKPGPRGLAEGKAEAASCRRCPLWQRATQTVFGAGPADAALVLVGEQPGDQEDLAGEPFVGPAGQLLRRAMQEAGLDERLVYLTNAVKHFKWEPRGKRRLHERPNTSEVLACQIWLELELAAIAPRLVVALGATAVRALLGTGAKVMRDRGQTQPSPTGVDVLVTVHPSSILRAPDEASRHDAFRAFVDDLRAAARQLDRRAR
jgi:uracil-DNA glycosylase family protein